MNILILHLSNTFNYGSMMMGENLITYLNKYSKKEINFYIDATNDVHVERLKKATKCERIYMDNLVGFRMIFNNVPLVRSYERTIKENIAIRKCQKKYDAVFILGGDDYSEEYYDIPQENKYVFHILNHLKKLNNNTKLFMIGQTIGPYTGERLAKAKSVFKNIRLYTRDNVNYEYVQNDLDCSPIKMADLAFLDLNLQNSVSQEEVLKKYKLNSKEYIVFVGTGLMHHYCNNGDDMAQKLLDLIKEAKEKYPRKKIVWLLHVVGKDSSDARMLNLIKNDLINENVIIIEDDILPVEARFILGNSYVTITCRMHAAVSTLQMGTPCICLSYSPKFKGVVGEGFDMDDFVIESKSNELWKKDNKELNKKVANLFGKIDENYDILSKKISKQVTLNKKLNEKVINDILKEI